MTITCFIRYEIDPHKNAEFEAYSRAWGQVIPSCGAELLGYYAPHEGSRTLAYGVYNVGSLAEYEAYRERLANHPLAKANYSFAQKNKIILKEDRTFLRLVSSPHSEYVKP